MAVKIYKPTSAGRRGMTGHSFEEITASKPQRALTETVRKRGGRNNQGRRTMRYRGGGHKKKYRVIDFHRSKDRIPAKVVSIEYDPNRSAHIALLHYADGEKRYIIAPQGLTVGMNVMSGDNATPDLGNALPTSTATSFVNAKLTGLKDTEAMAFAWVVNTSSAKRQSSVLVSAAK